MVKDTGLRAEETVFLSGLSGDIMRGEIEHRFRIIDFWKIREGSRILEIGCGQGETTAALAYTVGERGFIYGVDVADENYGEPENLGRAKERLMTCALGGRINMDFGVNILSDGFDFEENSFDYIILSHCLWYLASEKELRNILLKIRPWGRTLCIAEWDPEITDIAQYPHFLSANIQAICESYHISDHFNIRTMFYPEEIESIASSCGWDIVKRGNVYSPDVQDALWETDIVREIFPSKIRDIKNMPDKLKRLLLMQINSLERVQRVDAMSVYAMVAERI